jgi:hypothetical protein
MKKIPIKFFISRNSSFYKIFWMRFENTIFNFYEFKINDFLKIFYPQKEFLRLGQQLNLQFSV